MVLLAKSKEMAAKRIAEMEQLFSAFEKTDVRLLLRDRENVNSRRVLIAISPLVFTILLLSACGATQYTDPFAYCAAVGTIDGPDERYTGPKTPEAIVRGLMKAMDLPADAPSEPLARLTTWRCMSGKVYACNFGANIPCQERADTSRAPSAAMNDFCKANPASD